MDDYVKDRVNHELRAIYGHIAVIAAYKGKSVSHTLYKGVATTGQFRALYIAIFKQVKKTYPKIHSMNEPGAAFINFSDSQISFRIYFED